MLPPRKSSSRNGIAANAAHDLSEATLARFRDDPDLAQFKKPPSSTKYAEALALAFNMGGEFSLNSPIAHDDNGDDEIGPDFIDETIDDDPNSDDRRQLISQALPLLDARSRHVIEVRDFLTGHMTGSESSSASLASVCAKSK